MYEPAEDSFLLLDALAGDGERLRSVPRVLAVEIGPGSGVLSTYLLSSVFGGGGAPFLFACDVNPAAAATTRATAAANGVGASLDAVVCDLGTPLLRRLAVRWRRRRGWGLSDPYTSTHPPALDTHAQGAVDVLLFNPPYVPTPSEEIAAGCVCSARAGVVT